MGILFIGFSFLAQPAERGLEITVENDKILKLVQPPQTNSLPTNLEREIEIILETGQSTLLKLAQAKKKQTDQVITT